MHKQKSYAEELRGHNHRRQEEKRFHEMKELICDELPKRVAHNIGVKK